MTLVASQHKLARSAAMQEAVRGLEQAIASGGGVLVLGEPGTGRELFARAIHLATETRGRSIERLLRLSMQEPPPNGRPFVGIDCTQVNLESRLFGTCTPASVHVSDFDRVTSGSALRQAVGGTLLLRQVPELPAGVQRRLARVLRDGEAWLEANGAPALIKVDLRPIGTLEAAGDEERVIPELRKRFSKSTIETPPLRRRREDIPALVRYFLADLCASMNQARKTTSSQATELLAALPWPGNLTELKELLSALVMNVPRRQIQVADVLANIRFESNPIVYVYGGSLKQTRERFEREYVSHVLQQHRGRVAEAAKALGIQRTNLYRKLRKLAVHQRRESRERL